jgi:hypothetical protein
MSERETIVTPPGGPRPADLVHDVPPGHVVRRLEDGRYVIWQEGAPEPQTSVVITPGGVRPRARVHRIEPGHTLDGTGGRHRMLRPGGEVHTDFGVIDAQPEGEALMPRNVVHPRTEAPALGSGWITYAYWNRTHTITRFATSWVVPPAPASQSGQLIYIFNGIQNSSMIYQPVLQWGNNGWFGGNYWCVASWYADSQGGAAFHSTPVTVHTGDTLTGVMTLTGQSPQGFSYDCEFQGIANSGYPITNVAELWQAVETLECYRMTQASDYPAGKTGMASIDIRTGATDPAVAWTVVNAVTDVGQHTLVFDTDYSGHGEVDLWYGPSPYWTTGNGTVGPGASQEWWFAWGGNGDVGPQLIQAEPISPSDVLATTQVAEVLDPHGNLSYRATVSNRGSNAVQFRWRGGGR